MIFRYQTHRELALMRHLPECLAAHGAKQKDKGGNQGRHTGQERGDESEKGDISVCAFRRGLSFRRGQSPERIAWSGQEGWSDWY